MKGLYLVAGIFTVLRASALPIDIEVSTSLGTTGGAYPQTGEVETRDGVHLKYIQAGPATGHNLLFIPGWRQTAAQWKKQVEYFSEAGYRVTTYDMRGHGDSEKPSFGYRLSRFGSDLNDVLTKLDLNDVSIIAHSMGSSVTWAWWDQYPESHKRVDHFAIVDQSTVLVADPTWSKEEADTFSSALFTPEQTYTFSHNISLETPPFVKSMFTADVPEADYEFALKQNLKMSDKNAATLLINHAFADWRDVLPRIDIPALVISGDVSVNNATGISWAATQIPGAKRYTFTAEEKGSHFMFWENPERFNSIIEDFVTS
ncbi:non-heme chloroperoxidase [Fusarium albosuccineum]|uniref:Non-heme chloroperoxidase n=1 Tax=Fusarium albosuccineum TaxID=1237068 RepID=A0A8H4KTI2_9HYPO|nr:non-heme chloroperoxidase [Fusarium albosuccineum]